MDVKQRSPQLSHHPGVNSLRDGRGKNNSHFPGHQEPRLIAIVQTFIYPNDERKTRPKRHTRNAAHNEIVDRIVAQRQPFIRIFSLWFGWQVGVFPHHFRWQRVAGVFVGFSLFRGFTIQRCVEGKILCENFD